MTDSGPRPDVLAVQLSGLGDRFNRLEDKVDGLATRQELNNLIQSITDLANHRFHDQSLDIANLTAALASERTERITEDKENEIRIERAEQRADRARTFALVAIGTVVTLILGLIGLFNQLGGLAT